MDFQDVRYLKSQTSWWSACRQVKQGTENMIETYNSSAARDKKMQLEAQSMLSDAKRKIEYIRMQIVRLENQRSNAASLTGTASSDCMFMCFLCMLHMWHGGAIGRTLD